MHRTLEKERAKILKTKTQHKAFEALKIPSFPVFVGTSVLTMMADNVEHVISYWVAFQKFHSASLGGFAVIFHWLPFLLFSVGVGSLNDRFDSRRLIQVGTVFFMFASIGWGYFFITDTLTVPWAMALLVLHGFAGVFWIISSQVLLYKIVGAERLASAVRLNATARYFGVLVGPGVGSLIMAALGPSKGIFLMRPSIFRYSFGSFGPPLVIVKSVLGNQVRGLFMDLSIFGRLY